MIEILLSIISELGGPLTLALIILLYRSGRIVWDSSRDHKLLQAASKHPLHERMAALDPTFAGNKDREAHLDAMIAWGEQALRDTVSCACGKRNEKTAVYCFSCGCLIKPSTGATQRLKPYDAGLLSKGDR